MDEQRRPFVQIPVKEQTRTQFDTFPIEGYEAPDNFPNCCPFHKKAFEGAQEWFDKFPDCCKDHRKMVDEERIKKDDYEGMPLKILNQLSYTEYHISKRIDIPEWFEDITDYIDFNWWSFGHPQIGLHLYFDFLKTYLAKAEVINYIPRSKRERIIQYIESYQKPVRENETSKSDWNVLYDTLQKWVKTFPFELPYFKGLKPQYEGKIIAFKDPGRLNPYTGMVKTKGLTQPELIDILDILTKQLLGQVQTEKMVAEGQIPDIGKHRLELANESLRVGTDKLVKEYSKGELRYVTTVKKWLELQKKYFREVADIMGKRPVGPPPGVTLRPEFVNLFVSDAATHRAINAAVAAGIIDKTGKKRLGQRQIVPAIIQFWEAVSDRKFELTHLRAEKDAVAETYVQQCEEIAAQFGVKIGKTAIYDHAGKRAGKYFTAVARALGGT